MNAWLHEEGALRAFIKVGGGRTISGRFGTCPYDAIKNFLM
jgi:hypothetical protein